MQQHSTKISDNRDSQSSQQGTTSPSQAKDTVLFMGIAATKAYAADGHVKACIWQGSCYVDEGPVDMGIKQSAALQVASALPSSPYSPSPASAGAAGWTP
jgi:hypothetical protein